MNRDDHASANQQCKRKITKQLKRGRDGNERRRGSRGPVVVRSLVSSTGVVLVEGVGVRVERSGCGALERCVCLEVFFTVANQRGQKKTGKRTQ